MSNSKRTIYKPKKGRNVSQKKLYKLPSKHHGQRGGGFFDSLTSMLKGGEVPGAPAVDGDGNIVDVEDDKKEETPATEEEQTETPEEEKESEESTETPSDDGEEKESEESTETPSDDGEEKEGDENKSILKGVGETMGRSLSDAASEVQGYMTQSAAENDSADADYSDDDSVMESSNVNIQVPCDELLAENKQLREKIDQLQEEIKELLKNQLTKLESNGSDFSQNSTNEITPNMGDNSDTYDMSPMAPEKEEGFGEASDEGFGEAPTNTGVEGEGFSGASEEGFGEAPTNTGVEGEGFSGASEEGGDEDFSEAPTNTGVEGEDFDEASESMEPMAPEKEDSTKVEENVGGTKRHRKKNRKTKRKRNKHVSFHK